MRFGAAAMMTLAMCAMAGQSVSGEVYIEPHDRRRDAPLPSVANKREHTRGMNAAQLARLSAKNARRKHRR